MPEVQRTILLTGASSGIGLCALRAIAEASPATRVVVVSRTLPPGELPANVQYCRVDLLSRESVRSLVSSWSYGQICGLICNAGIMSSGLPKYTVEDVEVSVAINHLNQALLFFLLKKSDLLSPDCRIIFVTSAVHDPKAPLAPFSPVWLGAEGVAKAQDKRVADPMIRYANSKLENILFAYGLTRHIERSEKTWTVLAFEPGFVPGQGSQLGREHSAAAQFMANYLIPRMLWLMRMFGTVTSSPTVSGKAMAKLVLSDEYKDVSGKYILLHSERASSEDSYDVEKQEDVWKWTIDTLALDDAERKAFQSF